MGTYQINTCFKHRGKDYIIVEIVDQGFDVLNEAATFYNCIDAKGKKKVFFEVVDSGTLHKHSRKHRWL